MERVGLGGVVMRNEDRSLVSILFVKDIEMGAGLDAREAEVASTCGAVHERLQAITAAEQTLQAQNTACMHSEAEARSKQEAARREEDDVRLYTKEVGV